MTPGHGPVYRPSGLHVLSMLLLLVVSVFVRLVKLFQQSQGWGGRDQDRRLCDSGTCWAKCTCVHRPSGLYVWGQEQEEVLPPSLVLVIISLTAHTESKCAVLLHLFMYLFLCIYFLLIKEGLHASIKNNNLPAKIFYIFWNIKPAVWNIVKCSSNLSYFFNSSLYIPPCMRKYFYAHKSLCFLVNSS